MTTTTPTTIRRVGTLPDHLYNRLEWKAAALRERGVDVIDLGFGDPVGATPPPIVDAARSALDDPAAHHYTTNRGTTSFRRAVADYYARRFGVAIDPESEVLPALGAKECLFTLNLTLLDPGDVALVPDPGYQIYTAGPLLVGAEVYRLPLREERGFLPDLAAVLPAVTGRAKVLFLNYPNSPTGAVAPASFFAEAVAFAHAHDLVIVHDHVYSEITFDGERAPSILETPGAADVAVEVMSWSKTFRMTGWRCAALVGNREVIERHRTTKSFIDSGLFVPVQDAGIAALQPSLAAGVDEDVAVYQRRRDLLCAGLEALGFGVRPPKGSVYVWARVPGGTRTSSYAVCERILDGAAVALSPGGSYGPQGEGYVRFSLTATDERLREALSRMATVLTP